MVSGTALCHYSAMKSDFTHWSDLRVVLAVVRHGSTLSASKVLGMSQPTVARRIDVLEHVLGLTLFERDTRGLRPTPEGNRLMAQATQVEAAVGKLAEEAASARRDRTRPIRITAPRSSFSPRFAAILSDFSEANPGAHFEFVPSYEILDLVAGEADVALRVAPEIADERLICTKLTVAPRSLFASRAYQRRHGLPGSPDDLKGHAFVVYDGLRSTINEWLLARIDPSQIVCRCAEADAMLAAIRAGLGIGPLTLSLAADDEDLLCCFDPPDGTSINTWLVVSPDAYRRPEVKAFVSFFAPRFRAIFAQRPASAPPEALTSLP